MRRGRSTLSALWKYFVLLWPIYDRNSRSINPSIKNIKAIKKFSILEKKKDWDPCRSFHFFFLNSTHQARLFSSILFKITKIFRMTTKVNSSYMHTRYSYLCVWTYEEESSNETISLGQYKIADLRSFSLIITLGRFFFMFPLFFFFFFSIHSSYENEPLLWGYVYLLLARNSFLWFFCTLPLFPLYYPFINSIIVIFQTLGRSIFGEVFLVETKSWKDLVSHIR